MGDEAAGRGGTASRPTETRTADPPPPEAADAVRKAASQLLDATFASLSEGHVLPRPRFAPWIRMAHDYYGEMLRGGVDFDHALKAAWPSRFDVGVGDPKIEFASTYEQALIEDAVQAATRAQEPYASSSLRRRSTRAPAATSCRWIDGTHRCNGEGSEPNSRSTGAPAPFRSTKFGDAYGKIEQGSGPFEGGTPAAVVCGNGALLPLLAWVT